MRKIPKISDSEWQVMKILWEKSPVTAHYVVKSLSKNTLWSPKTIRTLLNRLVQKKALSFEKEGRQYLYYPIVQQQDCVREETRSFLQRVTGGTLQPMIAAFLEEQKLSKEDIKELKTILENKGRE